MEKNYKPRILCFMCNWCCYAAADAAGVGRMTHPPYHRVIRVMCSARVDPLFIFEGFKSGADAVMVGGCHLGDCKYVEGNYHALVMAEFVKTVMQILKIREERFMLEWASAAEPVKLVKDLKEFFKKIEEIGPLGVAEGWSEEDKEFYLNSAIEVCKNLQVRTAYGKISKELKEERDFSIETIKKKTEEKLVKVIKNKLYEIEVKKLIEDGPKSIDYLLEKTRAQMEELQPILNKLIKT